MTLTNLVFGKVDLKTLNIVLSAQNVPNGITETKRAINVTLLDHFNILDINNTVIMYSINKIPWLYPI